MRCRNHHLAVIDPFQAIRNEFSKQLGVPSESKQSQSMQGVRICESANEVVLSVDLPGVAPDAVDVTFDDGTLVVSGTRVPVSPETGRKLFSGIQSGDFQRSFRLDDSLDVDSIDAEIDLGVLTLTIPKRKELQPRKIAIRTAAPA